MTIIPGMQRAMKLSITTSTTPDSLLIAKREVVGAKSCDRDCTEAAAIISARAWDQQAVFPRLEHRRALLQA